MKLEPECLGCLLDQILRAFKLLKPNLSREIIISAQKRFMKHLITIDLNKNPAPILGKIAYTIVAEVLGEKDPYYSLKERYNRLALQYYEEVNNIVENSKDPLFKAILIAALGNTIDFASQHDINFISDINNFEIKNFTINDYKKFKESIEKTDHLLILGDNCGEIVFDKLLIITIKNYYPDLKIVYSVRGAPIINDATIEDAKFVGITELVQVVESSHSPGVDVATSPEEFKKHFFKEKGVILSKGQGNFESLHGMEIPQKDVYYLLKAKCNLMERIFGVKIGDLIFKKKTQEF
ncbi:MAG: ARMT1-like domain-containing protein [Candidatus Lokiarchaeia archaeon]